MLRFDGASHLVAGRIVGDLRHADDRRAGGRLGEHALDLLDRPAHRDGGARAPVAQALAQRLDVLLDKGREGVEAREQAAELLRNPRPAGTGRSSPAASRPRRCGRPRAGRGVASSASRLLLATVSSRSRVMTCSVSSSSTGIDSASARTARYAACIGCAALRPDVRQAIVEPIVAEDGGGDRVALEDALPEAVGEVVDEGVGVGGDGTSDVASSRGCRPGKMMSRARLPGRPVAVRRRVPVARQARAAYTRPSRDQTARGHVPKMPSPPIPTPWSTSSGTAYNPITATILGDDRFDDRLRAPPNEAAYVLAGIDGGASRKRTPSPPVRRRRQPGAPDQRLYTHGRPASAGVRCR